MQKVIIENLIDQLWDMIGTEKTPLNKIKDHEKPMYITLLAIIKILYLKLPK